MALFNNFPYTDLNDINLDYTLQKLESLYTRGEQLYSNLTTWQQATDAELEQWKAATESSLALWKTQTENSIDNKIQLLTAAINTAFTELRTQLEAHIAEIETTAVNAASDASASATAAAGAASAASINNEQSKEWAIGETLEGDPVPDTNPAYENNAKYYADLLGQETEQIDTNTADIADLKSAIDYQAPSGTGWETGFWSETGGNTSRRDYVRQISAIDCAENDVVAVIDVGAHKTGSPSYCVQFQFYDSQDSRIILTEIKVAAFINGNAYATAPTDTAYVKINISAGGTSYVLDPADYADVKVYINKTESITERVDTVNDKIQRIPIKFVYTDILASAGGWSYPGTMTHTTVGTPVNKTVHLCVGDKVGFINELSKQFLVVGRSTSDDTIVFSGWQTSTYTVSIEGDYAILAKYNDSRVITNIADFISNFEIVRADNTWLEASANAANADFNTFFVNKNVRSINHRGWYQCPENTLIAFKTSKIQGFECVETDIRVTSDGYLVCLHDATVDRTSNGTGNISDMTLEQAKALDFGSWKSSIYAGEQIPTFDEFIGLCKDIGLQAYVETKELTDSQIETLVNTVRRYGMQKSVTYVGTVEQLTMIKNRDSSARLGVVLNSTPDQTTVDNMVTLRTDNNDVFAELNALYITDSVVTLMMTNNMPLELFTTATIYNAEFQHFDPYVTGVATDTYPYGMGLGRKQFDYPSAM